MLSENFSSDEVLLLEMLLSKLWRVISTLIANNNNQGGSEKKREGGRGDSVLERGRERGKRKGSEKISLMCTQTPFSVI